MELVTAYTGKNHVTAAQIADFNRGIYGNAAILDVGNKLEASIQTANRITIKDGVAVFDGQPNDRFYFYIRYKQRICLLRL